MSGAAPVVAQPAPPQSPAPPGKFQDRIEAAAIALRESNPRFKGASREFVQGLAEFVSGNLLFVLLHELGHVAITQMGLPVPGKTRAGAPLARPEPTGPETKAFLAAVHSLRQPSARGPPPTAPRRRGPPNSAPAPSYGSPATARPS